jgi:hypothetical protein
MSINLRVRQKRRKSGLISFIFEINRNFRDPSLRMRPNHETVAYIGSVQEHFLADPITQRNLWFKIKFRIDQLIKSGTITEKDKQKIETRLAKFIPAVKEVVI